MVNAHRSELFLPWLTWRGVICSQVFLLGSGSRPGDIDYSYPRAIEECIDADALLDTIQT